MLSKTNLRPSRRVKSNMEELVTEQSWGRRGQKDSPRTSRPAFIYLEEPHKPHNHGPSHDSVLMEHGFGRYRRKTSLVAFLSRCFFLRASLILFLDDLQATMFLASKTVFTPEHFKYSADSVPSDYLTCTPLSPSLPSLFRLPTAAVLFSCLRQFY